MALVSYSDSEGSDSDNPQPSSAKPASTSAITVPPTAFTVDKSNPRKIRVNLHETKVDTSAKPREDDEPAPKRQRVAGGASSGFNSLLPEPKRDAEKQKNDGAAPRGPHRKIFSLKTGSERGFDREADAELRQLFAEQDTMLKDGEGTGTNGAPVNPPPRTFDSTGTAKSGSMKMFKPLSVARKPQKKKNPSTTSTVESTQAPTVIGNPATEALRPAHKISLFSMGGDTQGVVSSRRTTLAPAEYQPMVYEATTGNTDEPESVMPEEPSSLPKQTGSGSASGTAASSGPQSLDAIASDLHLSASARRQLLGRNPTTSASAINVINFNTDQEYAANEVLRASGEQVQHNPVRAPSSGKQSLKQLVNMASGQKDALEESFAAGRQNKREAGNRYGW